MVCARSSAFLVIRKETDSAAKVELPFEPITTQIPPLSKVDPTDRFGYFPKSPKTMALVARHSLNWQARPLALAGAFLGSCALLTGLVTEVRAQVNQGGVQTTEGAVMVTPGAKGAQMYCFMRANGNSFPVSWNAAYALVKRQKDSVFKTSEEHASVMISEAVVQNPGKFPDCGRYLGDLFTKAEPKAETKTETKTGSGSGTGNRN